MLIVLYGRSGSGKSAIANKLSQYLSIERVVTSTTRPMRNGESNGKDYFFLDKKEFNSKEMCLKFFVKDKGWKYGVEKDKLDDYIRGIRNGIIVCDPSGVRELKSRSKVQKKNMFFIFISARDEILLERSLKRGDDVAEICRRFLSDKKDFEKNPIFPWCDMIAFNNETIEKATMEIMGEFTKWLRCRASGVKYIWDVVDWM